MARLTRWVEASAATSFLSPMAAAAQPIRARFSGTGDLPKAGKDVPDLPIQMPPSDGSGNATVIDWNQQLKSYRMGRSNGL